MTAKENSGIEISQDTKRMRKLPSSVQNCISTQETLFARFNLIHHHPLYENIKTQHKQLSTILQTSDLTCEMLGCLFDRRQSSDLNNLHPAFWKVPKYTFCGERTTLSLMAVVIIATLSPLPSSMFTDSSRERFPDLESWDVVEKRVQLRRQR